MKKKRKSDYGWIQKGFLNPEIPKADQLRKELEDFLYPENRVENVDDEDSDHSGHIVCPDYGGEQSSSSDGDDHCQALIKPRLTTNNSAQPEHRLSL